MSGPYDRPRPNTHESIRIPEFVNSTREWGDVWPDPVDGNALLADLATQYATYVYVPEGGLPTLELWTTFTWCHECFHHSPILALTSPIHGAGKTRVQEVMTRLVPKPEALENPTGPSLFGLGRLSE